MDLFYFMGSNTILCYNCYIMLQYYITIPYYVTICWHSVSAGSTPEDSSQLERKYSGRKTQNNNTTATTTTKTPKNTI